MASRQRAKLTVAERDEFGSRRTRRLRRDGFIPGVVYGGGDAARAFKVSARDVRTAMQAGGAVIDLVFDGDGGGKPTPVVVKDQQRHPVRGDLVHLDLLEVKLDVAIQAEVPLELEGVDDAPGVKEGGVLEHVTREITIEALPTDIPERIDVDVSEMNINDTIQLAAVTPPEGVKFIADEPEEVTVATLTPPRVEEEPEPEVEEEAELVGEEAEAPEGAESPAEAGAAEEEAGGGEGGEGE